MPQDRYIPNIIPSKSGEKNVDPLKLQDELAYLWEAIHALSGRLGTAAAILNSLSVTGSVTATGNVQAGSGTGNLGQVQLSDNLQLNARTFDTTGSLAPAIAPSQTARIYFDPSTNLTFISENLGAYRALGFPSPVGSDYSTLRALASATSGYTWDLPPHARVTHSATQTALFTTSTQVQSAFDTDLTNVGGVHSTVTNNSRLTMVRAGWWIFGGELQMSANAAGNFREIGITLNGLASGTIVAVNLVGPSATSPHLHVSGMRQFALNDYIEIWGNQDSGSSLDCTKATEFEPIFWACWLAP